MSELSYKTVKTTAANQYASAFGGPTPARPSSRHKRHAEPVTSKASTIDKKTRKRRTLEKIGASVDHENRNITPSVRPGGTDEDLAARIKSLENKWRDPQPVDKKPKDLMRAIGKIETSDWNIKEIEKKIQENKLGKPKTYDKEKVPKWSKEQFIARQTKMEKKHYTRQDSAEAKFAEIDKSIKNLDQKLKEGTIRELGTNKVASITEKLSSKVPAEKKPPEKSQNTPRTVVLPPPQVASELCHFCGKRVYLMERLSAEGRFFHHACFKCQYCNMQLRLGSYAFDRDGMYGFKFFCQNHFGMVGEPPKITRRPAPKLPDRKSPEKRIPRIAGVDLLDKVQTPERAESAAFSTDHVSSDQEEEMDEDEWTDKNFGASCAEVGDSEDDDSSSLSDTDTDDEDAYDDALEEPVTKEGTMKWAERWKNSYSRKRNDSGSDSYSSSDQWSYENSSDDDNADTATEGEEEIRARELRRQEVRVEPPVVQTDTGTDTEVKPTSNNLTVYLPDILSSHDRLHSRSSDNLSDFNSAESGDLDLNMNKIADDKDVVVGKLTIPSKKNDETNPNPLSKSATSGDISNRKPLRNFVIPKKGARTQFGAEFVPKFKNDEPEPLLIIKRTPSKVNLPKEVGKPKVALSKNVLDTQKYFGNTTKGKPPKKPLQRSETISQGPPRLPLVKQSSLPETSTEKEEIKGFNFEPADEDLKDIDSYIENLLANEEELEKPIDPSKYKIQETPPQSEDEKVSSSIEDLLKALETEGHVDDLVAKPEEKMDDLLAWMEGLEYDTQDRKVCRSFSDVKYKHLEKVLKTPKISDAIVSKIPRNNLSFFESHLSGRPLRRQNSSDSDEAPRPCNLKRSNTEIHFKKGAFARSSVDLDAVSKVDIKKMLQKFERSDNESSKERSKSPVRLVTKRNSFAAFRTSSTDGADKLPPKIIPKTKPIKNTIKMFESGATSSQESSPKKSFPLQKAFSEAGIPKRKLDKKQSEWESTMNNLEKFVQETLESIGNKYDPVPPDPEFQDWCAKVTVQSIPNTELMANVNAETGREEQAPKESCDRNQDVADIKANEIEMDVSNQNQGILATKRDTTFTGTSQSDTNDLQTNKMDEQHSVNVFKELDVITPANNDVANENVNLQAEENNGVHSSEVRSSITEEDEAKHDIKTNNDNGQPAKSVSSENGLKEMEVIESDVINSAKKHSENDEKDNNSDNEKLLTDRAVTTDGEKSDPCGNNKDITISTESSSKTAVTMVNEKQVGNNEQEDSCDNSENRRNALLIAELDQCMKDLGEISDMPEDEVVEAINWNVGANQNTIDKSGVQGDSGNEKIFLKAVDKTEQIVKDIESVLNETSTVDRSANQITIDKLNVEEDRGKNEKIFLEAVNKTEQIVKDIENVLNESSAIDRSANTCKDSLHPHNFENAVHSTDSSLAEDVSEFEKLCDPLSDSLDSSSFDRLLSESDTRANIEDLYAKVRKDKPYSPQPPRRLRKGLRTENSPPQKPERLRKKSASVSPSPMRKVLEVPKDVRKQVGKSSDLSKPETFNKTRASSDPSTSNSKNKSKSNRDDSDKDCCLQ